MPVIEGWKFPIQVDETTGKIKTVKDNENIKQNVRMIIETQKNERKLIPSFGTDLRSYMFEVVDTTLTSMLKRSVEGAIDMWEEHVRDLNVQVVASTGTVSNVDVIIDYLTDIEPTQERIQTSVAKNEI